MVCQKLCQMLADDVPMVAPGGLSLPSEIHDLACHAVTICSPGDRTDKPLMFSGPLYRCVPPLSLDNCVPETTRETALLTLGIIINN